MCLFRNKAHKKKKRKTLERKQTSIKERTKTEAGKKQKKT